MTTSFDINTNGQGVNVPEQEHNGRKHKKDKKDEQVGEKYTTIT